MKLADNEIRDINKLLEAGNPLPDKYRFLLSVVKILKTMSVFNKRDSGSSLVSI